MFKSRRCSDFTAWEEAVLLLQPAFLERTPEPKLRCCSNEWRLARGSIAITESGFEYLPGVPLLGKILSGIVLGQG
jgi:hypothetical protein